MKSEDVEFTFHSSGSVICALSCNIEHVQWVHSYDTFFTVLLTTLDDCEEALTLIGTIE
jgi:hypothetical protein